MRGIALAGVLAVLSVTGCSSDIAQQEAAYAALAFIAADPPRACDLLAPETAAALISRAGADCPTTLAGLELPSDATVERVEVAGESAQVQLSDQVMFLARFPDGWRVTAAGCVRDDPDPAVPYECEVKP